MGSCFSFKELVSIIIKIRCMCSSNLTCSLLRLYLRLQTTHSTATVNAKVTIFFRPWLEWMLLYYLTKQLQSYHTHLWPLLPTNFMEDVLIFKAEQQFLVMSLAICHYLRRLQYSLLNSTHILFHYSFTSQALNSLIAKHLQYLLVVQHPSLMLNHSQHPFLKHKRWA